ncbi:hypothetical protein [Acetobacter estunensis]|uniref:hypothetical protein n=1 Tax=Acetobacter estunensis TaxID=104097 RepID=UPI001C2D9B23|nr:hypothetical protein [Acetobacter estunensis]MBV1835671.1 hypothetical protein [Acetobacter estunensis]MBV1836068.1 hypothetical protein [Acetobacter estunensis]
MSGTTSSTNKMRTCTPSFESVDAATGTIDQLSILGADGKELDVLQGLQDASKSGAWNPRGAWAANTAYAVGDYVTYEGTGYVVATAFMSGATFDATNLTLALPAADPGTPGKDGLSVGAISVTQGAVVAGQPSTVTATPSLSDGTALAPFTFQAPPGAVGAGGSGGSSEITHGMVIQPTLTTTDLGLTAPIAEQEIGAFSVPENNGGSNQIVVDPRTLLQEWIGVGCAITDSVAYNLLTYFPNKSDRLALYDKIWGAGGQNTMRTEIGPCDYRAVDWPPYIADDVTDDWTCSTFALGRDELFKLKVIREVFEVNPNVKVIGSAWTPPLMFKTSYSGKGPSWDAGSLIGTSQVYAAYALYISKFCLAYQAHGVPIWAVTMGNENNFGSGSWPSTYLSAANLAAFAPILGAQLLASGLDTRVMGGDVSWGYALDGSKQNRFTQTLLNSAAWVQDYAFHNYEGSVSEQIGLLAGYTDKPVRAHMTEYCADKRYTAVLRAQMMIPEMFIGNAWAWGCSITLWNMLLDDIGGPWQASLTKGNTFDGVLNFNRSTLAVTETPEYYYLTHIAEKFPPGTRIIKSTCPGYGINYAGIQNICGMRPDGSIVVALFNNQTVSDTAVVRDGITGTARQVSLAPYEFGTLEWSAADIVTTPGTFTTPSTLTNLAAVSTNGNPVFSWVLPSTATSDIAGIRVTGGTSASDTSFSAVIPGNATSYIPEGFSVGETVYLTFTPFSVGGDGPTSAQVSVVVTEPAADAPTVSAVATVGGASITVTPSSAGTAAASFDVYAGATAATMTKIGDVAANGTSAVTYAATGLTAGTLYYIAATPIDADGTSGAQSDPVTVTPLSSTVPDAPSISLTPGDAQVTIDITPPANNGGQTVTSYTIYSGTSASALSKVGTVAANGSSAVSYVQSPEPNGTLVYFAATATNSVGEGAQCSPASTTPAASATVSSAPTFTLTAGDGQITVSVVAPSNNGGATITGYPIVVNDASSPVTTLTAPGNYVITGLTNGTATTVKVGATNSVGTTYATDASATPEAASTLHEMEIEGGSGSAWTNAPAPLGITNAVEIRVDMDVPTLTYTDSSTSNNVILFGCNSGGNSNGANSMTTKAGASLVWGQGGAFGFAWGNGAAQSCWMAAKSLSDTAIIGGRFVGGGLLNLSGAAITTTGGLSCATGGASFFYNNGTTDVLINFVSTTITTISDVAASNAIAAGTNGSANTGAKMRSGKLFDGTGKELCGVDFTTATSAGQTTFADEVLSGTTWTIASPNVII